jgi:hypothetical protein
VLPNEEPLELLDAELLELPDDPPVLPDPVEPFRLEKAKRRGCSATCTAPRPMMALPQPHARRFAKAIPHRCNDHFPVAAALGQMSARHLIIFSLAPRDRLSATALTIVRAFATDRGCSRPCAINSTYQCEADYHRKAGR